MGLELALTMHLVDARAVGLGAGLAFLRMAVPKSVLRTSRVT